MRHITFWCGRCDMNDPNGPFFDAAHGVYHVFYQDHLWAPMPDDVPTGREGPVWGHAVSRDMVHWAHMPVGLWNGDGWYDMHGLYTGSATLVDGLPVLVFPGVCDLYPPGSAVRRAGSEPQVLISAVRRAGSESHTPDTP